MRWLNSNSLSQSTPEAMALPDILDTIVAEKRRELLSMERHISPLTLGQMAYDCQRKPLSISASVAEKTVAIIAEHKRRSPSKGEIKACSSVAQIAAGYEASGAAAISVLTDSRFFGGSLSDLAQARMAVRKTPLLRKDFIIDPYQIHQARIYGADAVLLIAAILSAGELSALNDEAHNLGLETLVEVHSVADVEKLGFNPDLIGVNSRNLRNFDTDLSTAGSLFESLPADCLKIAESGVKDASDICRLRAVGYNGFLIGEALMSAPDPAASLASLIAAC